MNHDAEEWDERPRPPYDLSIGPGRDEDNRRFGELLERLRWKAGLSRTDAASKVGFSSEYLRLLEVGRRTPALGQMQRFIDAYGATAEIERVMPGGDRPDLAVMDPLSEEPLNIEFVSRIREARRRALGGPPEEEDEESRLSDSTSPERALELGTVVALLVRSDDRTLRRVREILERGLS